ncbi:hypothetical protein CALCODRAFT_484667 [Calocera cornea HHB12733]|uniref:NADH-ubiquinone oxidoreductase 9.5 kDa subunit n=1 Tax=Calocera cornea HHB12733 TaxID=1353952 RepID=A0A165EUY2_9BASI|nr:hypothetical protein CALCODRAFT_484667 [Calocera cornea HHB12733]
MASIYRFIQRSAHEKPVYFWSCIIGAAGPIMLIVVPPIRRKYYVKPEDPPFTYPIPQRARKPTVGFEDPAEWAGKWNVGKGSA